MRLILFPILMILCSCSNQGTVSEWDYSIASEFIENINDSYKEKITECVDENQHQITMSFISKGFSLDSFEIILVTNHQVLYRGYESKFVKSDTVLSCKDSFLSDLEQLTVFLFDHKNKKAYHFQEKEVYVSSELSDILIYLNSNGSCAVKHNNLIRKIFLYCDF